LFFNFLDKLGQDKLKKSSGGVTINNFVGYVIKNKASAK